jgi:hypothetical protein
MAEWGTPWTRVLQWGTKGDDVSSLHISLWTLFRENWKDKYPVPDGKLFTFGTKKAVEHFQRRIEIPITGKVDEYTWDYLQWALECYDAYYLSQANASK